MVLLVAVDLLLCLLLVDLLLVFTPVDLLLVADLVGFFVALDFDDEVVDLFFEVVGLLVDREESLLDLAVDLVDEDLAAVDFLVEAVLVDFDLLAVVVDFLAGDLEAVDLLDVDLDFTVDFVVLVLAAVVLFLAGDLVADLAVEFFVAVVDGFLAEDFLAVDFFVVLVAMA